MKIKFIKGSIKELIEWGAKEDNEMSKICYDCATEKVNGICPNCYPDEAKKSQLQSQLNVEWDDEKVKKIEKKNREDIRLLNINREYLLSDKCEHQSGWEDIADLEYLLSLLRKSQGEKQLRKLLWLNHGCTYLYGDDGEMQCGKCLIDFKRDAPDLIERKLISRHGKFVQTEHGEIFIPNDLLKEKETTNG